jgi:hypothetical protein
VGGYLLDGPAVAVGIAEEDELAPRELLHIADFDAALDELGARGVETVICMPWTEPGAASVTPLPMAIEQADPGGVSWTKRISSLTARSWSALKPTLST